MHRFRASCILWRPEGLVWLALQSMSCCLFALLSRKATSPVNAQLLLKSKPAHPYHQTNEYLGLAEVHISLLYVVSPQGSRNCSSLSRACTTIKTSFKAEVQHCCMSLRESDGITESTRLTAKQIGMPLPKRVIVRIDLCILSSGSYRVAPRTCHPVYIILLT